MSNDLTLSALIVLSAFATPAGAAPGPAAIVYAGSAHLRVVDAEAGAVAKKLDLGKAINAIRFAPDGSAAYVAASDGVRELDGKHAVAAKLTSHPARNIEVDGDRVYVLEHEVIVNRDETREILPFRMVTVDRKTRAIVSTEEIGQRILYARPPLRDASGLVITESGDIRLVRPGQRLTEGEAIDASGGLSKEKGLRVRQFAAAIDGKVYVPVEGIPSRILEIDLASAKVRTFDLGGYVAIRGIGRSGDSLLVNASDELIVVALGDRGIVARVDLSPGHTGLAQSSDGRFAFLAQTIDGTGGAVTVVSIPDRRVAGKIHLDDLSPWVIAVRPAPR
jgi:hypothetical protein